MENHSPKFLRQRKFLLILPALVVPFISIAFWALGGGKGSANKKVTTQPGLNTELPGANVKNDPADKMGFYEREESDSDKIKSMMKSDPYFKGQINQLDTGVSFDKKYTDPNEAKVYNKLSQLHAAMDNAAKINRRDDYTAGNTPSTSHEAERLQKMIQTMKQGSAQPDPEMNQINGMLEKILDIQHPDRVKENSKQNSFGDKEHAFPVEVADTSTRGFYSLDADTIAQSQNAIGAAVYETQTVVSGSTVKLRLLNDIYITGQLVPKNNFIFGTASLQGERLNITVKGIRCYNSLLPVALYAYDMDGLEGIYIPGAILRDVAKQSSDNALQTIGLNSLDPSIGAQAAGAGIQAAKTLISKKVKLVRVTVKAGYRILLKQNN